MDAFLKLFGAALSIWDHKEANKYRDEKKRLEMGYYAEYNKPIDQRSDAILDDYDFRLRVLASAFCAAVTKSP